MSESPSSFYFASRRPRTGSVSVSNEIQHLTPRQERSLAKQQSKSKTSSYQAEDAIIEHLPTGAKREDFLNFSRPIIKGGSTASVEEYVEPQKVAPNQGKDPPIGSFMLPRAVPIKIEPKVFFAAERTFLLWMHSSLWLIAGSMTILAYAKDDPQKMMYGATIFPVGIVFIIYALYQCKYHIYIYIYIIRSSRTCSIM